MRKLVCGPLIAPVLVALFGALAFALSSCGGGSSGGGDNGGGVSSGPPFIFAELDSFPPGAAPPGSNSAVVIVTDSNDDTIANAVVMMNGVTLAFNAANEDYEGDVAVNPGDLVTLSVIVNGATFTASASQFTSYPTISAPAASGTWDSHVANTATWTGGAPTQNAEYVLGILDTADPNGALQWPNQFLQEVPLSSTSFQIPAFSIPAGSRTLIIGISSSVPIASADPQSEFVVEGFNFVPITVTGLPVTVRNSGTTNPLIDVTWSGSEFMAVGGIPRVEGTILTSPDGITWTPQNPGTTAGLFGVVSSGAEFVAVGTGTVAGQPSASTILRSADGISWSASASGVVGDLTGVASSGALFVATGSTGGAGTSGTILTSTNGVSWSPQTSGTTQHIESVIFADSQFVAVGTNGLILTSPDGAHWTLQNSGTAASLKGIAWSGTQFVAVGTTPDTSVTSPDGVAWTPHALGTALDPRAIAWSSTQSQFLAVGGGFNSGTIQTSPDGITWTRQAAAGGFLQGIAWSGTNFVIVGGSGTVLTSP